VHALAVEGSLSRLEQEVQIRGAIQQNAVGGKGVYMNMHQVNRHSPRCQAPLLYCLEIIDGVLPSVTFEHNKTCFQKTCFPLVNLFRVTAKAILCHG